VTSSVEDLAERAWVEAARQGDLEAFNRLVERYQRLAYNVALRTIGQPDEAADATQDAFLAAFRGIHAFRGESFRPWLLRIVVNACYDQLRRQRRQPAVSIEALTQQEESTAPEPADTGRGPELVALDREMGTAIEQALDRLPPDQRLVAILCDVQELSYDEAAAVLEVPIGTIRSRLSRARARLRDELTATGELRRAAHRLSIEDSSSP
jgi:RNA polymerase sigma-70 factor (ECF subfamily)